MRTPFSRDERGSVLITVALAMSALLAAAGLAIDFGYFYMVKKELQVTADSSALAASSMLSNEADARQAALTYATQNMPADKHGNVLIDADVEFGVWNESLREFQVLAADVNAVRVTTRRATANGNPVFYSLGQVLGFVDQDLAATAIAMMMPAECFQSGGVAGGKVIFGQDAGLSGFCMYGRQGVTFGQDAVIENGAQVGALSLADITFGKGATYPDDALVALDDTPSRSHDLDAYIDDLESGAVTIPGMSNVVSGMSLPDILVGGTIYIVDSSTNINSYNTATDVFIAVRGNIQFGQDASLINTGDIDTGGVSIGVIATGDVKFVQDGVISGVDVVAGKDIIIGQNVGAVAATFSAGDNIHIGQNAQLNFNPYDPTIKAAAPTQAAVLVL